MIKTYEADKIIKKCKNIKTNNEEYTPQESSAQLISGQLSLDPEESGGLHSYLLFVLLVLLVFLIISVVL